MIELRHLTKTYRMGDSELKALDGVSLTIKAGEYVAIMGPSGSGKSTLMHLLGLLDLPDSGSYQLAGDDVTHLSDDDLARRRGRSVGFVFQQFNLLPRTSAEENVGLPLVYTRGKHDVELSRDLLKRVGLGERLDHKPNQLSGGQQQRVSIARSLVNSPSLLLADEPTGALDSRTKDDIMATFAAINASGITVVIVTHEMEVAQRARRIITMRDGRIVSDQLNTPPADRTKSIAPVQSLESPVQALDSPVQTLDFQLKSIEYKAPTGLLWLWGASTAHLRQALRSLALNKLRSALSMLGILIGVAAVIAMLALGSGARRSIETQLSSLGSNLLSIRPGSTRSGGVELGAGAATRLTVEDVKALAEEVPGIRYAAPIVSSRAQVLFGDKNWNTQVVGTLPEYTFIRSAAPVKGRFFTAEEDQGRALVAVIGRTVAMQLFGKSDPLGEWMRINRISFQIIGILPTKGAAAFGDQDDTIIIPVETAMHRLMGKSYIDSIDADVKDASLTASAEAGILQVLSARHRKQDPEAFQIRNMADIQQALSSTSQVMSALLAVIASISLIVGGIGIMNIMLVSVAERTREIGLRKAIGATRTDVLLQFLIEAMVISTLGGAAGIFIGWSAAMILSHVAGWSILVSSSSIILAAAFSMGIGIFFGFWPARSAAALRPIEALRHE